MHNLKSIAFVEKGICPAIPRHNVAVQLDGDPVRLHAEALDQRGKCERSRAVGKLPLFPIDVNFHCKREGAFRPKKCGVRPLTPLYARQISGLQYGLRSWPEPTTMHPPGRIHPL